MKDTKQYLKDLEIDFKLFAHPAVYTCEEMEKHIGEVKGIHSKNLFLKDRKSKRFYLVVIPADRKLSMEELSEVFNDKLKFANENDLKEILSLTTGAVSPFGLINDEESNVIVVIDKKVWNSEFVSFHPNINTETMELKGEDFQKYVNSLENELILID